jgi:hypothetical protein
VRIDIVKSVDNIIKRYKAGVLSRGKCCECKHAVNTVGMYNMEINDVIVFKCGHAYHRGCAVEQQK